MTNLDDFPREILLHGARFKMVAKRRGVTKAGVVRYEMLFDNRVPVACSRVQIVRGRLGLQFPSPLGPVVFEFLVNGE